MNLEQLRDKIRAFVHEREWERFHTPKNLAMALIGEAAELTEIFQWLTAEESAKVMDDAKTAEAVRDEIADVLVYLLRLGDVLNIDLESAVTEKLAKNAKKYPLEKAKGKAVKYTDL